MYTVVFLIVIINPYNKPKWQLKLRYKDAFIKSPYRSQDDTVEEVSSDL